MTQGDVFSDNVAGDKTEFSSDIAIIYRMDAIHKQIHTARTSKNYDQYYEWLISLYMELVRVMKDADEQDVNDMFQILKKAYFGVRDNLKQGKPISYESVTPFYAFEERLTKLEQTAGLGFKRYDARYAMGGKR